jgi:4-alpha-glucanotransferase
MGNSPYSAISAFAGNPLMISLERLAEHGWIDAGRLSILPDCCGNVEFEHVKALKLPLLFEAAKNFLEHADGSERARYEQFCRDNSWWLDDYVAFVVLRDHFGQQSWNRWPEELARHSPDAMARLWAEHRGVLDAAKAIQFAFFEQWRALRRHCEHHGIRIVGDVAIFVSFDSSDVWTHPDIFRLDQNMEPEVVAGVPPDYFSVTGQRWGNPLYRWDVLRERGYDWWVQRMRWALTTCDLVRLDHFRGFEAYWEIPGSEPTAVNGQWVPGPGDDLFNVLRRELGSLPLIAEDLGFITPEVHALRERLGVPGMRVMQFGFGDRGAHIYLPHRFEANTVVYTGTHDNDTIMGWWHHQATAEEKQLAGAYLGADDSNAAWAFVRSAMDSVARFSIVPLQDVLGLGSEARINVPSRPEDNWAWRFQPGMLTPEIAEKLALLVDVTDRAPQDSATGKQSYREAREDFSA